MATHYLTYQFVVPIEVIMRQVALHKETDSVSVGTQTETSSVVNPLTDTITLGDNFPAIVPLQDDIIIKDDDRASGQTIYISDPRYLKENIGGQ